MNKEHILTPGLLWLMAVTTGVVVANNYYNQPLLGEMAKDFNVSEAEISNIPMLTQVGYALGLFFIVPLGDMFRRKKLILIDFLFILAALFLMATSPTLWLLKMASLCIGISSVIPQIMVPMAAQLAKESNRGKAIGVVMTGMFIGILGSRTLSGFIGDYFGWRTVYYTAIVLMSILWLLLKWKLPEITPEFQGSYKDLLKSVLEQFKIRPKLRLAAIRGGLDFACFSAFWTTLIFLLESSNFELGSKEAGSFGFIGIAGTLLASYIGKLSDNINKNLIISIGIVLIMLSWFILGISDKGIIGLIIGALFLDMGVQSVHITNQTIIFENNPPERNRINTVYMVCYFIGGALGTVVAGWLWQHFQWTGVATFGGILATLTLIIHLKFKIIS